jgi:hypothetical protein
MKLLNIFFSLLLANVVGCASIGTPTPDLRYAQSANAAVRNCALHLSHLDAAIDTAGVRDGAETRVDTFPYLRVNRFLASFTDDLKTNSADTDARLTTWIAALRELDRAAREAEIKNLPASSATLLQTSKSEIGAKAEECAAVFMAADTNDAARRLAMIEAARVPDDYSLFKRALGFYPLTKYPFFRGVDSWQRNAALIIQKGTTLLAAENSITRYVPKSVINSENVVDKFRVANRDSLGIPSMPATDWQQLFDVYAPIFEVETATNDDRIGALRWYHANKANSDRRGAPTVNIDQPAAYRRVAYTRIGGRTFAQLVYSVWFPSRPASGSVDLLSGALDAVIWRVTLDENGRPLIYDSIHACGCYHLFFPTSRMQPKPAPNTNLEWAFVPKVLPSIIPPQRMVLRIAAASHYIVAANVETSPDQKMQGVPYTWRDDEELRALPTAEGNTRSIFQPNGLVAGTERGERFLFWPMGIVSPGAMRQWGRHATAFVGIRHFDDADLLDKRFTIVNKY